MIFWIILFVIIANLVIYYKTKLTETGRILTKGIGVYLTALVCIVSGVILIACVSGVLIDMKEHSISERMDSVEYYYYSGDYTDMREYLSLHDCFEEQFSPYWEIAEAQQLYHEYLIFEKAAAQNETDSRTYEKQMKECRKKLFDLQADSRVEENRPILAFFADSVR